MANGTAKYVRFLRGTPTAYANIVTKDPDTLYFISEKDANNGDLYLGTKLIAGREAVNVNISLGDLTNVITSAFTDNNSFLVFDEDQGKWVTKTPQQVAGIICGVMTGATATEDGAQGLVPAPKKGEQELFLRGDATWADPTASLKSTISIIVGDDGGRSIRQIAVDVLEKALIPENAKESLDTLQEISDWIQNHPDDASAYNTRITALEDIMYDTVDDDGVTVLTKGLASTVGDLSFELSNLKSSVSYLREDVNGHTTSITNILERLRWHDINDDGTIDDE